MGDIRSAFEKRKEAAWTTVYEEYFRRLEERHARDGSECLDPTVVEVFRSAVQQTTSSFTVCDNDMQLADCLFQLREDLESALTTLSGGKT